MDTKPPPRRKSCIYLVGGQTHLTKMPRWKVNCKYFKKQIATFYQHNQWSNSLLLRGHPYLYSLTIIGPQYFATVLWSILKLLCVHAGHRYTREIPELLHFYPGMGLKLGVFGFSCNQNNCDLSGVYELRCERDQHVWNAARCAKIVDAFCLCLFPHVWSVKTRIPPVWAPWYGWRRHWLVGWRRSLLCIRSTRNNSVYSHNW